jgi:hypothetical protein
MHSVPVGSSGIGHLLTQGMALLLLKDIVGEQRPHGADMLLV